MNILKFKYFIIESSDIFNVKEFLSLDDIDSFNLYKIKYNNRKLTNNEMIIINEYISKFENIFLMKDELIKEILLDIDLIEPSISIEITKWIEVKDKKNILTEFNAREEIKDVTSLVTLKRWYDQFLDVIVLPKHNIEITKNVGNGKLPFNNDEIYQFLKDIDIQLKNICDCEVKLDKGGNYAMRIEILYPLTTIKI